MYNMILERASGLVFCYRDGNSKLTDIAQIAPMLLEEQDRKPRLPKLQAPVLSPAEHLS